jgi:type II secretion system protein H
MTNSVPQFKAIRGLLTPAPIRVTRAFTLVELLLVMSVIVMVFSIALPTLASFFRGRTLDSEARRLVALTHSGQSRAVSEGVPMRLWVNAQQGTYGLQEEAGWTDRDAKAVDFRLDPDLHIEVVASKVAKPARIGMTSATRPRVQTTGLPEILFLPDGSFDDTGPQVLHLSDRNGVSLWVAPSGNRLSYEIHTTND